jgi:hypothetical protein
MAGIHSGAQRTARAAAAGTSSDRHDRSIYCREALLPRRLRCSGCKAALRSGLGLPSDDLRFGRRRLRLSLKVVTDPACQVPFPAQQRSASSESSVRAALVRIRARLTNEGDSDDTPVTNGKYPG